MMETAQINYIGGLRTRSQHLKSGEMITTDAPTDNHGKGEYFSPTDLVASALGSCMLTVLGIAASTFGFSIDGATASVTKVMSPEPPRRISQVVIELKFPDIQYTEKEKTIIEKVARSCPVALSLHPEVKQEIIFHFSGY